MFTLNWFFSPLERLMQFFSHNKIKFLSLILFNSIACNNAQFSDFPSKKYLEEIARCNQLKEISFNAKLELDDETFALFETISEMLKIIDPAHSEYFEDLLAAAIMSRNTNNIKMVLNTTIYYCREVQQFKNALQKLESFEQICLIYQSWLFPKNGLLEDDCCWFGLITNCLKQLRDDQKMWSFAKGFIGGWTFISACINPLFAICAGGGVSYILGRVEKADKVNFLKFKNDRREFVKADREKKHDHFKALQNERIEKMATSKQRLDLKINSIVGEAFNV